MIAVVASSPQNPPCAVQLTRRVGFKVGIRSWCQREYDGSHGVLQMPDTVKICPACSKAIAAYK